MQEDFSRGNILRAYFEATELRLWFLEGAWSLVLSAIFTLAAIPLLSNKSGLTSGCAIFFVIPGVMCGSWGLARTFLAYRRTRRRRIAYGKMISGDKGVQEWLNQGLARVKDRALCALGLPDEDLTADLLTVVAPVLWSTEGVRKRDLLYRKGTDGQARFGVYSVATIALAEKHLGVFRCEYNFIEDAIGNERTTEYHYQDIVAVSTGEEASSLVLPWGEEVTSVHEFRVSVTNGEGVRVVVDSPEIRRMTGSNFLPASGAEKAVRAIRAMLRSRKI